MAEPLILVIGAASMDIKGRAREPLIAMTSNPGSINSSCGGEARNIAENLARLGLPVRLLSAVGCDATGTGVLDETLRAGVDVSRVITSSDYRTAAYVAILDDSGNLVVSIDDMQVLKLIRPQYLHRNRGWFKDADMVVLGANLTRTAIESALKIAEHYDVPVAMNTVSVTLAHGIMPFLDRLVLVAANLAETSVIVERPLRDHQDAMSAAKELVGRGVEIAIVTLGENGLCYATSEETGYLEALQCDVVDKTGAGAALMAAVIYGLVNGFPPDEAMRLGVSAATLTLKCSDTVCSDLSLDSLYDQLIV